MKVTFTQLFSGLSGSSNYGSGPVSLLYEAENGQDMRDLAMIALECNEDHGGVKVIENPPGLIAELLQKK